ncbi:MAG TPA: ABC transporter permease [Terriglobales bacterium]
MNSLIQDIRFGSRMLLKAPGFTAVAVIVLALGIGANTAIFSVVNAVLLRPLPYPQPDRLVQIWHTPPQSSFPGITRFSVSPANYLDWANQSRSFEQMAIYGFMSLNLTGKGEPESILATRVSSNFFSVLKTQPMAGRVFSSEEDSDGHGKVVVISHSFWQSHFGADPNVVGQTISLNSESYTIVGIMPAKFAFPTSSDPKFQTQMWTPIAWTDKDRAVRGNHNYLVIGRLKLNADLQQAKAEMNTISSRLEQQYPADDKGWGATVIPMREQMVGEVRTALMILCGAVGFVLLIACANVANLVLVKTLARQKEIAIRTALGASSARVLRQILAETLMLSLCGGVLGLAVAHFGVRLIVAFLAQRLPFAANISLDISVLSFTLLVSLLTGVIAGVVPAFRATKTNLNDSLKAGLGRTDADSGGNRTRSVLVVSEMALSLVLLIGAGLMIRSLSHLRNVDPGMDTHNVVIADLQLSRVKYAKPQQQFAFYDQLVQRLRTLPGVESASAIDIMPLSDGGSIQPIAVEGRPMVPMADQPEVAVRVVEPEFMRTMRIPLLQGRMLNTADTEDRPQAILISDAMAKRIWPGENPVGKRLTMTFFPEKIREVVGVVGNVKQDGLDVAEPAATLYLPMAQAARPFMTVAVRATQPGNMAAAIANAVHEIDREQPVNDVVTMDTVMADSVSRQRFNMLLLGTFAGLALVLAAIGLYSVLAYSVRRRVREIGVRMALGAQRMDVIRMILGQGVRLALIGVAIGVVAAFVLTRLMASQLFQVSATDPLTFIGVAGMLVLVAIAACYIPARRASKVDPMVALRYE